MRKTSSDEMFVVTIFLFVYDSHSHCNVPKVDKQQNGRSLRFFGCIFRIKWL